MTRATIRRRYRAEHGALKQPRQGWTSLAQPLWLAYSIGIAHGFTDLGTYVAKALDHGGTDTHRGPPAWAFDLGRKDRFLFKGWGYLKARRLAKFYWENHLALDIEYVILGHNIISRSRPYWHYYSDPSGSHSFHIHVSGHWPGRSHS
jgi:hypothetical protein